MSCPVFELMATDIGRAVLTVRRERCLELHYRLMARPGYWYDQRRQQWSTRLCVHASDIRRALREHAEQMADAGIEVRA